MLLKLKLLSLVALTLLVFGGMSWIVPAKILPKGGSEEPAWLANKSLSPTWAGGIGYLIENRCVSCHRPDGEAPMSFGTYGEVQTWVEQIRIAVNTGTMPPINSPNVSASEQELTARELKLFDQWSSSGFPKGDGEYVALRSSTGVDSDRLEPNNQALSMVPTHEVGLVQFYKVHEEVNGYADSAISPDGKWFAFGSRRSGNLDVWIADTETKELRRVTNHPAPDYEARWHPDSTKIAFVSERNGNQDIFVHDLKTGIETAIATEKFNEDYPSFSKDGKEIVFTGGLFGSKEVRVYNYATGKIRQVTEGFGYVGSTSFSPDGQRIVFHSYFDGSHSHTSDVYVVSSHGGAVTNITNTPEDWDYKANWSRTGDWIVFSSKIAGHDRAQKPKGGRDPYFNLFVMRSDGSELRQITNVKGMDLRWANWTEDGRLGWHGVSPQQGRIRAVEVASGKIRNVVVSEDYISDMSPYGDKVLYETNGRVYVLGRSMSEQPVQLTRGVRPRWSRDGKTISFVRFSDGKGGIGTIAATGGEPIALAWVEPLTLAENPEPWMESQFMRALSPNGKTQAAIISQDGRSELVLISEDGNQKVLTDDGRVKSAPIWSSDGDYILYLENSPRMIGYYLTQEKVVQP